MLASNAADRVGTQMRMEGVSVAAALVVVRRFGGEWDALRVVRHCNTLARLLTAASYNFAHVNQINSGAHTGCFGLGCLEIKHIHFTLCLEKPFAH